MKKTMSIVLGTTALVASFAFAMVLPAMADTANWDTTGDYIVAMEYQGSDYPHDVTLTQDEMGNLSGNGGSPAGDNTYLWTIEEGVVNGDAITFTALYTDTQEAVDPQTTVDVVGVIAEDGTMSGTWSDNYQGEERSGTWSTTEGMASPILIDDSETVTVTIDKFIEGEMATADSANNADFPMTSMWETEETGSGSGSYSLSETNSTPYRAITNEMSKGADYETEETLDGNIVGATCTEETPFALVGYTTGTSHAAAMEAAPTMTVPSFTNLQEDMFVIVWNNDCNESDGEIGGEVIGDEAALEVTSIEMVDTTATANGSFADGWEYVFHITAPMSEENLAMKFSDWMETGDDGTIPVANNMRISSLQADNGGDTILLTAKNVYSTPDLTMVEDLDPSMDGRQVEITVEVAVPNGTPNGSYTTNYGVRSNP